MIIIVKSFVFGVRTNSKQTFGNYSEGGQTIG